MIIYNPKQWFSLIFRFHKAKAFTGLLWAVLALGIVTAGIVFIELEYRDFFTFKSTIQIHSLLGFVIGLLLVFRTNTGYDRWWEGRKLWGRLVNDSRNLSIKLNGLLPKEDSVNRAFFSGMISNYSSALKDHLRGKVNIDKLIEVPGYDINDLKNVDHVPNAIAAKIYERFIQLKLAGKISGEELLVIDKEIKSFTDILGACERIKNTPIPFSYNLFIKKFIFIYTITMPLGLAYDYQYWTIPIVCFTLYVFGSLELLAEEIEDPFGTDYNDLPTDTLAQKINKNVEEILIIK